MLGAFVALDLFLFYVFWELMLVPMVLIIGIWGGAQRVYAAVKFFLYTMVGSMLMLVAILYLVAQYNAETGHYSFALADLKLLLLPVERADVAVRGVRAGVRDQGADVPVPHLVAGRARAGADRRLGDPGRGAAEDGHVRLPALRDAAVPGGAATARRRRSRCSR